MAINPLLFKYKGDCCAGCGLTVEDMRRRFGVVNKVFQFNHVDPEKKHSQYDNLIRRVISTEQLDEVDKCVLLCNNCHDVLHAQSVDANLTMIIEFAGKVVKQQLKCQGIFNFETKELRLFPDTSFSVKIYAVGFPPEDPEFLADVELRGGRLLELFLETETGKQLLIREKNKPLVVAVRHSDGTCRITTSTSFPFFSFDDCVTHDGERLWIRNHHMIVKSKKGAKYTLTTAPPVFNVHVAYSNLRKSLEEVRRRAGSL